VLTTCVHIAHTCDVVRAYLPPNMRNSARADRHLIRDVRGGDSALVVGDVVVAFLARPQSLA
jgi:hypothetical protein